MGMQESPLAPGWYNSYVTNVYEQGSGNPAEISKLAKQAIQERASYFLHHPQDAVRFYMQKEITQWSDPSFDEYLIC